MFKQKDITIAKKWIQEGIHADIEFSGGTYQVSVLEPKSKKRYWPFLQLNDAGKVIDGLCNCSSEKGSCAHLAVAYLKILGDSGVPLHRRFRASLWNQLCQMAFVRHGSGAVKKVGGSYKWFSPTKKLLFSLTPKTTAFKAEFQQLVVKRTEETEETSLKFSNLSQEELVRWKQGNPSVELQYELSFWADLAKKMMLLQEKASAYQIAFIGEGLPSGIEVRFKGFDVYFYIALVNWPLLVPCLELVEAPLKVFEFQNYVITGLTYDEETSTLHIEKKKAPAVVKKQAAHAPQPITVGDWTFIEGEGFFPKHLDQLFDCDTLPIEKIGFALNHYPTIVQKYLKNAQVHLQSHPVQYEIRFDDKHHLHIICYAFHPGDLQLKGARYFNPWAYIPQKGFYRLEQMLFNAIEKVVPFSQVNEFINRHRAWLGGFEGFHTHIYQLESHVQFEVTQEQALRFSFEIEMVENADEVIDFGEWVYVAGKGFFSKRMGKVVQGIRSGTLIAKDKVASFIQAHREELEMLPHFFASRSPLRHTGLQVFLNAEGKIVVKPHFEWKEAYIESPPLVFGNYTYVPQEGFSPFPSDCQLPSTYCEEKVISQEQEPYFIFYELEQLSSLIVSLQPELKKISSLQLQVRHADKQQAEQGCQWIVDAFLESEVGDVDLFEVWEAVQEGKKYLFSSAGCLLLQTPRFNWLKGIGKRHWQNKGKQLRLSSLEWFRLMAFEQVDEEVMQTGWQEVLTERFSLNLDGFKSQLRSYQEMGVRWLFSLFTQGLSGFLCDEMGLGKTHQAMGLICAVLNRQSAKVLIVCPTSVIYHWEALLARFLPNYKVLVFYGSARSLAQFDETASILLTSYGTLRSEIASLSEISFELAVFDELQVAKNSRSQTHKALRKLKAKMRLGLTGTPLENRLLELKALFDLIVPTYLPSESQFRDLFISPIEKNQDVEKKALLARLIKPFILRRKKAEVLPELPEKIEEIAYCPLSEEQQALYHEVCTTNQHKLLQELQDEKKPVPYLHVFSLLSQLKQICDHPCLVNKDFLGFRKYRSGKWDLFVELLQEIRDSGQKVVIFSQYLEMLNLMQMYLEEEKIGYASIRGATRDRKEQLEKFKEDPQCEVFLASLQAVGVGVDLVSASVVIHYDRWWNPAKENQATDRVHRMGQNRGVQVFKMVTKGTIEEHIHSLIEKKKNLMEGVIGFDEHDQIKGFTREELLALVKKLS